VVAQNAPSRAIPRVDSTPAGTPDSAFGALLRLSAEIAKRGKRCRSRHSSHDGRWCRSFLLSSYVSLGRRGCHIFAAAPPWSEVVAEVTLSAASDSTFRLLMVEGPVSTGIGHWPTAETKHMLRFVTTAGQADQSVTLLEFLRVLPASSWLRASILWADDLAAIWPERYPTPMDREREQSLQEIQQLQDAGFFRPKYIFDFSEESVGQVLMDLRRLFSDRRPSKAWEDGASAVGPMPSFARYRLREYDPETFVYRGKLPESIVEELKARKLLRSRRYVDGYVIADAELLNLLLAAHASVLYRRSAGRLVPDVQVPEQARCIAAPTAAGKTRQALVIALMSAITPDLQTDFRSFIDFRKNEKNERARRDYIEQLTGFWNLFARGGQEHAFAQTVLQVTTDLRKARQSYFERVRGQALTAGALTALGAVIPLLATHPTAAVVGALSTAGASAATIAVREDAPIYLRAATRSELLAPTASI
jgi:hypothetical protein